MNGNFMDRFRALDCNHCWNTLVELSQLRPKTADANSTQEAHSLLRPIGCHFAFSSLLRAIPLYLVIACSFLLGTAPVGPAYGETVQAETAYALTLDYPEAVGDVHQIDSDANYALDEHGWAKEKDLGERLTITSVKLTGRITVLALSKNQRATKASIRIDTLMVTNNGKTVPIAKAGDELILERKDDPGNNPVHIASINGKVLDVTQTWLVSMAINLFPPSDNSSANRMYNLSEKKHPGESWPINSQAFIEAIPFTNSKTPTNAVKGTVKFLKAFEDKGEQYGLLQLDMNCTDMIKIIPEENIISKEVKTSCLLQVQLNGKQSPIFTKTDQTTKSVSNIPMNANGTPWVLHLESTSTFHQAVHSTFLRSKK